MNFIGRKEELAFLEDCYASPKAQLIILYGRRRVGKTELLREFSQGKPHVFSASKEAPASAQLSAFSQHMFAAGAPAGKYLDSYRSWEDAFEDIPNLPMQGKKLVIIDEFPYIAHGNPSIPSILQNTWDSLLKNQDVMLVLCGSSMSFIEKELLSEKTPLYGRATGILKLQPMPFWDAAGFFPNYTPEEKALAYCTLGGIPHYMLQFDPELSVADNIQRFILRKGSALYSETEFLMRQEFRETATYNSIVQAVALGATQLNEISQKTLVDAKKLSTYIKNLIDVGILQREFPASAGVQEQSKPMRGLYRACDNFFRFWYAYVFSNLSALEMSDIKGVWDNDVLPTLHEFCSVPFEDMCRAWVLKANKDGELPCRCSTVGRWWNSTCELDILALDKGGKHAIVGECKFRNALTDERVLNQLREKTKQLKAEVVEYELFSLNGFSDDLREIAAKDSSVRLVDMETLYNAPLQASKNTSQAEN